MASLINKLRAKYNLIPKYAFFNYQYCPSTTFSCLNDSKSTTEFPTLSKKNQYPNRIKASKSSTKFNKGLTVRTEHGFTEISSSNRNLLQFEDLLTNKVEAKFNKILPTYSNEIMNYIPNSDNLNRNYYLNESVTLFNYLSYSKGSEQRLLSSQLENNEVFYSSSGDKTTKTKEFGGKPTKEQLTHINLALSECLPKFFKDIHNYRLYHNNLVFENKIKNVTINGLVGYVQHLSTIKILSHLRYASVKLQVLKITQHEDDCTVRVRWRISGVSGIRSIFMFWKFRIWDWKNISIKEAEWVDGFSIFYVGSDGLIYKHVCDKMMPDENRETTPVSPVGLKLALLLGLAPKVADMTHSTLLTFPADCL